MQKYIWQNSKWPNFTWDESQLTKLLGQIRVKQGHLIHQMNQVIDQDLNKSRAIILEQETLKTALIEGEKYDPLAVRSSIHERLHLPLAGLPSSPSKEVVGLIDVMLDAVSSPGQKLELSRLYAWHASLFPTGYSRLLKIKSGKLRDDQLGPMQVVSGSLGHEKIHYQAPSAAHLSQEVKMFLNWWNHDSSKLDGIIRAGIAHFYFITIHPFDDGNGRLARVLTDLALAQDDQAKYRYYSLSSSIIQHKNEYYQILEKSQKGDLDITSWLVWFLEILRSALDSSEVLLADIFAKTSFWYKHIQTPFTTRQQKVINKIMDAGRGKFNNLSTRRYMDLNHGISRSTAIREIQDLLDRHILSPNQGRGRSVSYHLNW